MEICVDGLPISEKQLTYHCATNENKVIENICTQNNFVRSISIHSFRSQTTVCETIIFAHSFYEDFLSTVSKSSRESVKSLGMYGAFNPSGNTHFHSGSAKYYSPTDLSKICRHNQDSPLGRDIENIEQEKPIRHHQDIDTEKRNKKKAKDKKNKKREFREETSYGYYMMNNKEDDERKERNHRRDRKKEFSELNYYDLQCILNDCNKDINISSNMKKDRNNETKKHHRSQSIDQIPTKDVTSDQKISKKPERPRSAERREDPRIDKNKEYLMKYYGQCPPLAGFDQSRKHFIVQNQQFLTPHSPKRHKDKMKSRKKNHHEPEMPEFVTLDQIDEQTMNLKDEKFDHHQYNKWDAEKKIRHHQQREFYGEYHQQQYRNNLNSQNNEHDFNKHVPSPDEYEKMIQNYYQTIVNKEENSKLKKKEKKKEKINDHKKKENDEEYRALKKYMKKLVKGQQKDTYYFTTKENDANLPVQVKRDSRGKKYLEEHVVNYEHEFNPNNALGSIDGTKEQKLARKEFIPLDLGLEELEISSRYHKNHDLKKYKNKRKVIKKPSSERIRSASLCVKDKQKNLNEILQKHDECQMKDTEHILKRYKSETSLDSTVKDKEIVCIYQSKDSPEEKEDTNTVKLTKKQDNISLAIEKKYNKKDVTESKNKRIKDRSPYDRNQMILPSEHKKQMSDVLNMQERTLLFQKAMKRDFPTRPRPRLSRSRQRSSRYLSKLDDGNYHHSNIKIDEEPTKEVHCYDVGTSTILDNNFGEVLELLRGEPSLKTPCMNKKRSVFHVKKKTSREDLVEASRKTCENGEQTLGIVVKGIEPPKKIETSKVRSRFKFPSEKPKINKLECKILSVVAITPTTKFDDEPGNEDSLNPIKTQSTPQMKHESISEKRIPSSDKRLERLLKYYKVEAQSKISDQSKTSQKSMKELIASKLSDYLKKLQNDDNDEMLQIQTDEPKVVKLVLPIEFSGLQCSDKSISLKNNNDQIEQQPKESFSDLNINYSAEIIDEDEDYFDNLETPKDRFKCIGTNRSKAENSIFNQNFDLKINDQQSEIFLNQNMLNFSNIESTSEFPFSPRITEKINRNSQEFEKMREFSCSEEQGVSNKPSSKLPVQKSNVSNVGNSNQKYEYDYYIDSERPPVFQKSEDDFNPNPIRKEQSTERNMENVRFNTKETAKKQQISQKQNMSGTSSIKESSSFSPRRNNERSYEGTSKPSYDNMKSYKVDDGRIVGLQEIVEDNLEDEEESVVNYANSSVPIYQPALSRNEGLRLRKQIDNNDENITLENDCAVPSKSSQKTLPTKMFENNFKQFKEKEYVDSFPRKDSEVPDRKMRMQENDIEQTQSDIKRKNNSNDLIRDNTSPHQAPTPEPKREPKVTPRKVAQTSKNNEITERKKFGKKIASQPQPQTNDNSSPSKAYDYFEIPAPNSTPIKKTALEERNVSSDLKKNEQVMEGKIPLNPNHESHTDSVSIEPRSSRISQIPKKISNIPKNVENFPHEQQQKKKEEPREEQTELDDYEKCYENLESTDWFYQKEQDEMDNSLEKCLYWNTINSETVVMSELNVCTQNKTSEIEKTTGVPRKSQIPVVKKNQKKPQSSQGKAPSATNDKNAPTMLLTKTYKVPAGQSSYERRKMYDTRIRKNVKRRSLSESSGPKNLPLIYEVRYCNVYNQCLPEVFDPVVLGRSKSDQNMSILSTDFDENYSKISIESLTTAPSCFLKENQYEREEKNLSTEPSCLLKENKYCHNMEREADLYTEPSCLLKESKYNVAQKKYEFGNTNDIMRKDEETCSNFSSKSERIKELIKENLLYARYSLPNKKTKPSNVTRKRRKRVEKEKLNSNKTSKKITSRPKITLRCSEEFSKEKGKRLKIITKLNDNIQNEDESEISLDQIDPCLERQNLTKLSIDKLKENEFRVSFENQKPGEKQVTFDKKSIVCSTTDTEYSNDRESLGNSISSESTVINCAARSSITSQESEATVKERDFLVNSADDSGYLTKGAEINHSGTTIISTNDEKKCCSKISKGFSSGKSKNNLAIAESSRWNQKDLVKLRIQLLFPHVYDDFELLESAQNTDLIKYYVESENNKLKEAIDSISQKDEMSTRSRSVISLPSVKMIPEEPTESTLNGDLISEYSSISREGGFYNYQKFVAQNNACYSANVLSKLSKPDDCGDCTTDTLRDHDLSEKASVNSCELSSVKSGATLKKSVVELFKLRPSSAKKSSSVMLSDNETLVEENEEESASMCMNISDEEFFNNFHQIMAIECKKFARKVKDQSHAYDNVEDDLKYEEIPLDCLLKNKNLNDDSSEDYLENGYELASDEICDKMDDSKESFKKESNESFKSVTCIKENMKPEKSNSKWQKLLMNKSSHESNSKLNLNFYSVGKVPMNDMIENAQTSNISEDSLNCSPRDKVLNAMTLGEVTKQSEKQFFDSLLAFYDKEAEFIKKLMRDEEFFSSLIESIRNSDETTQLIFMKDIRKKAKKEKKKGIFSRFFRWKEKKSTETLFENPSNGRGSELAQSVSNESKTMTIESCCSFYKDLEDLEAMSEIKNTNSEHLQQLAYKAKCHLEPMVKATISNRHISDKIKLAGFLKMLDMVAKGDFTFLNNGDKSLEEKLRDHVAQMFEKVYMIANREVVQKNSTLDNEKIQLLKILVTKYHMGVETHINILSIYIGRGLIETTPQLEDAIIFLMGQDSQDINLEQFEKNCGISSE
ncbi:uncharacterized protein LOC123680539 [Harmonia axyridis]|uniref:uncharacterized protein LOC123680539 n=1 Tax=Harmonia axyridis TaxID=115357 RepID=UPI001E278F7A|nr:uncharacterized protein LOC123680539 [Harmonia axyridis]